MNRRYCGACGKRTYDSKRAAKRAHQTAGFRLHIYWCEHAQGYHCANKGKR